MAMILPIIANCLMFYIDFDNNEIIYFNLI